VLGNRLHALIGKAPGGVTQLALIVGQLEIHGDLILWQLRGANARREARLCPGTGSLEKKTSVTVFFIHPVLLLAVAGTSFIELAWEEA
jgi:hypothetical protein